MRPASDKQKVLQKKTTPVPCAPPPQSVKELRGPVIKIACQLWDKAERTRSQIKKIDAQIASQENARFEAFGAIAALKCALEALYPVYPENGIAFYDDACSEHTSLSHTIERRSVARSLGIAFQSPALP